MSRGDFVARSRESECRPQMSFRYHQMAVSQWGFSKSFGTRIYAIADALPVVLTRNADDATPIGPCLVSAQAIPDPQKLALKCTVNGKILQDGNTSYVASANPLLFRH